MKFSSALKEKEADQKLAKNLKLKFGEDSVIIIGNWSASMIKFHEPIKGVGVRRALRKQGFKVFLID
jgi:hypothetical protein